MGRHALTRGWVAMAAVLLGTAACGAPAAPVPSPAATPTVTLSAYPSTPVGSAYPPDVVMGAIHAAAARLGEPLPARWDADATLPDARLAVCELLMAGDPATAAPAAGLPVRADYVGHLTVNPITGLGEADRATTVAAVDVAHLADAQAADRAVREAAEARCASAFALPTGREQAWRAAETTRLGDGSARLTTGTLAPDTTLTSMSYVPGEARVVFAHGPLVIDVLVLSLRPSTTSPAAATAAARGDAIAVASDIIWGLPR